MRSAGVIPALRFWRTPGLDTMAGLDPGGIVTDEENSSEAEQVEAESTGGEPEAGGGSMFKKLFLAGLIAGVAAALALAINQRQKLAAMSDDEIRAMLDEKLGGRVSGDQLAEIQDAVIAGVRRTGAGGGEAAAVTGTVAYRERIAMPPDAVVIVQVEDTSLMDVPAEVIGTQVIESPGSVPVPYSVGFDPGEIVDSHTYSVRATISSGDTLLWTTDTASPVITRGNPLTADLLLVSVPEPVSD